MTTQDTLQKVELGITAAENALPLLEAIFALIPGASAAIPFLQLLPVAANAVKVVQQATGGSTSSAISAVQDHLTPGAPNHPALSENATPPTFGG